MGCGADVDANRGDTLLQACSNGSLPSVKCLVEAGADIHIFNDRFLYIAHQFHHENIVEYLLSQGSDLHKNKMYRALFSRQDQ